MVTWTERTTEQLFAIGEEQPNSQFAYDRQLEIQRRAFVTNDATAKAQIRAAESQVVAAEATAKTARWTMISAIAIGFTVLVTGFGVWIDAFSNDNKEESVANP